MSKNHEFNVDDVEFFTFAVAHNFIEQIEKKIDESDVSRKAVAKSLEVTPGRVSQLLNNPGNLSLQSIVNLARSVGMKVSLLAYDDGDLENLAGPIHPEVFCRCWESRGKPTDLWSCVDFVDDLELIPTKSTVKCNEIAGISFDAAACTDSTGGGITQHFELVGCR